MDGKKRVKHVLLSERTMPLLIDVLEESVPKRFALTGNSKKTANKLIKDKSKTVVVQIRDGKPSGYMTISHHKGINEVSWMYVKDEFKGKGLSRKMHKKAYEISKAEGLPIFANPVANTRARRAVDNLGKITKARADRSKKQSMGIGKGAFKKKPRH